MLRLRCVPFITKKALASTTSEARMTEVDVVVIIFSAHPVGWVDFGKSVSIIAPSSHKL